MGESESTEQMTLHVVAEQRVEGEVVEALNGVDARIDVVAIGGAAPRP